MLRTLCVSFNGLGTTRQKDFPTPQKHLTWIRDICASFHEARFHWGISSSPVFHIITWWLLKVFFSYFAEHNFRSKPQEDLMKCGALIKFKVLCNVRCCQNRANSKNTLYRLRQGSCSDVVRVLCKNDDNVKGAAVHEDYFWFHHLFSLLLLNAIYPHAYRWQTAM